MSVSLGKRKRTLELGPQKHELLRQVVTEQLDLEIGLKNRLLAAVHARMEWANILRNAILQNDVQLAKVDAVESTLGSPSGTFREAALAAYEAIETSCQIISSRRSSLLAPITSGRPPLQSPVPPPEAPRTRKRVTLGLAQVASSASGPILFQDRSTGTVVKLVCTDCSRQDFPTIQGFLNHCRLAHGRVYGTHDECIRQTGVRMDDTERDSLVAAGVDINAIYLPSLRGMFEQAVGLGAGSGTMGSDHDGSSTHLSQTLGFHMDTPMLAPFLGKEVKKKKIHVWDDEDVVDILSQDSLIEPPPSTCIIKLRSRKNATTDWSVNDAALAAEQNGNVCASLSSLPETSGNQMSRFHVTRRVTVSDRSLYLSESKRPTSASSHTHRWQLSISTPSYGQHISTFLDRFTVTCITQPPVFNRPIMVAGLPFIACSTTDRPFLARITLHWVGEQNQAFEIDHWVELDQSKAARPVLGEEQIFDVELDRHTVFSPVQDLENTLPWDGDSDYVDDIFNRLAPGLQDVGLVRAPGAIEPEHSRLLKTIVARFPMTMQGNRQSASIPYPLQPTRAKLLNLVPGRRKALEWRRALAIRVEYNTVQSTYPMEKKVTFTTGEVFRWLDSHGLFPRPPVRRPQLPASTEASQSTSHAINLPAVFCPVCGVNVQHHNPISGKHYRNFNETNGYRCSPELERRRTPIIHVYALVAPSGAQHGSSHMSGSIIMQSTPRELLAVAHPQLTRFVSHEVALLSLPCYSRSQQQAPSLLGRLLPGKDGKEVAEVLAPHALLAIALEKVVRDLVKDALQVAVDMQARTKAVIPAGSSNGSPVSLLTPTHLLQGLLWRDIGQGNKREALCKCFSRLGTLLQVEIAGDRSSNILQRSQ
ncbi:hypothetical protein BU17DRAFT_81645 [Hysterangium stoloniferum]|nr:hypothetical protein BU17DRAFT_81645 [Hysterangium stoloniferum]